MERTPIALALIAFRERHDLTQRALARAAGVTAGFIGQVEIGEKNLPAARIEQLRVALELDASEVADLLAASDETAGPGPDDVPADRDLKVVVGASNRDLLEDIHGGVEELVAFTRTARLAKAWRESGHSELVDLLDVATDEQLEQITDAARSVVSGRRSTGGAVARARQRITEADHERVRPDEA